MVGNVRAGSGELCPGNQHTFESIKIASRQTRQTLMMARLVMMTTLVEVKLTMVKPAKLMSWGCYSADVGNQHTCESIKIASRWSRPRQSSSRLRSSRPVFQHGFPSKISSSKKAELSNCLKKKIWRWIVVDMEYGCGCHVYTIVLGRGV